MEYAEGTLIGERSFRLVHRSWLPDGVPKAVAVVVHGIGEHMGRYTHVVEALVQRGYGVHMLDHRGHGASEGVRAHVERFDYFVADLHLLVRKAKDGHHGLPTFMIGHSMGGLIATHYALRHQAELDGLVLSGPALQIGDDVSPMIKRLSGLIATLVPRLPIVPMAVSSESLLSRDPAVDAAVLADALVYKGKVRARIGHELVKAAGDARSRLEELRLPLLIMHGTDDKIANPQGSLRLYEQVASSDKTLKLWQDCRHEIFNELEKADVIAFAADWLDERVRRSERQLAGVEPA